MFLLVCLPVCVSVVTAQAVQGAAQGGQSGQTPDGLYFDSLGRRPHSIVYPGGVVVLNAVVFNYGDQPESGTLVATVGGVQNLESARRITVPPQRKEIIPLYVQVPQAIAGEKKVEVRAALYVEQRGQEVILKQNGAPAVRTLLLTVEDIPSMAALLLDPEPPPEKPWAWPPPPAHWSFELVFGARIDSGAGHLTAEFDLGNHPLDQAEWEGVDLLVISQPDSLRDVAFLDAIRTFLTDGGRVWIMLDRVPCAAIRPLLGVGQAVEEVDTIEINHAVVELHDARVQLSEADRTIDSDAPLRLVRVVQSGGWVSHTVDGWPLAIWMTYGLGEILLTTLDAQGWVQPRPKGENSASQQTGSQYTTRPWGHQIGLAANLPRSENPTDRQFDYPLNHIGDPVVPRRWVAVALVMFCGMLAGLAVWAWSFGSRESLLWGVPVVAVIASGVLIASASFVRRDVTAGVARLQLIQVTDDGSRSVVKERSAVYLTEETDMTLQSERDGVARADENIVSGIQRFEMTGYHRWRLSNRAWPAGIWRYQGESAEPMQQMVAEANLTDEGIRIELPAGLQYLEDPVLSYVIGVPYLCRASENEPVIWCDGRLPAIGDRWIADTLLSSEQLRRIEVYKKFFAPLQTDRPMQRVVCGWTHLTDQRPQWSKQLDERGAALIAIPVRLRRPPVGQPVYIPPALIRLRSDRSSLGQTAAYNNSSGRWASELTMGIDAKLEFDLPPEVLPFEAQQATLEFDIHAPHRIVELSAVLPDGSNRSIVKLENPSVPWNGVIRDATILAALKTGRLRVNLRISERTDVENPLEASNLVTWKVQRLALALRGKVAPSHELAAVEPAR